MKKQIFLLFLNLVFLSFLSAQSSEKNLLFRELYPTENLSDITVDFVKEELILKSYNGTDILVEVSCNNRPYLPIVSFNQKELKIKSVCKNDNSYYKRPDYKGTICKVFIYIPENFVFQNVELRSVSADIQMEGIKIQDSAEINNVSNNIQISNCKFGALEISNSSGIIHTQEITCDYFNVNNTSGSVKLGFLKAPLATSNLASVSGDVELIIPRNQDFYLSLTTVCGEFSDNFSKTTITPKKDGQEVNHSASGKGPVIKIKTVSGNIILNY